MKSKFLLFPLLLSSAFAADAPVLSLDQMLDVRTSQAALNANRAEIAELESRLKDLYPQRPVLQKAFEEAISKATPEGFKLQADLSLVRCKWAEEPGCGAVKAKAPVKEPPK